MELRAVFVLIDPFSGLCSIYSLDSQSTARKIMESKAVTGFSDVFSESLLRRAAPGILYVMGITRIHDDLEHARVNDAIGSSSHTSKPPRLSCRCE